jgi:hypothetical protein
MQNCGLGEGDGCGLGDGCELGEGGGGGGGSGEGWVEGEGAGGGAGEGEGLGLGEGSGVGDGSGDGEGSGVGCGSGDGCGSVPAGAPAPTTDAPPLEGSCKIRGDPPSPASVPPGFVGSFSLCPRASEPIGVSGPAAMTASVLNTPRGDGERSGRVHARNPITITALIPAAIAMTTSSGVEPGTRSRENRAWARRIRIGRCTIRWRLDFSHPRT